MPSVCIRRMVLSWGLCKLWLNVLWLRIIFMILLQTVINQNKKYMNLPFYIYMGLQLDTCFRMHKTEIFPSKPSLRNWWRRSFKIQPDAKFSGISWCPFLSSCCSPHLNMRGLFVAVRQRGVPVMVSHVFLFRWQSACDRHQHSLPPGTDAGNTDPRGKREGIWGDWAMHGISSSPQDSRNPLHTGKGWCKTLSYVFTHRSQTYDITFPFLCKNNGKEHVGYFNTVHSLLDECGILRKFHICMIVVISVRLEWSSRC